MFMRTISKVFIFGEIGERLLEMQSDCSVKQLRIFDGDLDEIRDELTDADLVKIFNKRYDTDEFDYVRGKELPVIKIENLNHSQQSRLLLSDINLNVYYEDKIALIQKEGTSAIDSLLDIIMGFANPHKPANNQAGQEFASKVEVYGKRIETLRKHHLRKHLCYLKDNPPLFLITLRGIIDPTQSIAEELIVKVLHFLGFFKEFCTYIDKTEIRDVRLHLTIMEMISEKQAYFANKVTNEVEAKIQEEKKKSTPQHITGKKSKYFEKPREKTDDTKNEVNEKIFTDKTKKLVSKIKTSIRTNRLLTETRRKHIYKAKVSKLNKEIRDEVDTESEGNSISNLLSFGSKDKSTKENNLEVEPTKMHGYLTTRLSSSQHLLNKPGTKLSNYVVVNSDEREIIGRLLNCRLTFEDKQAPLNLRRIIWMARAILQYPEILIIEEDAFLIEGAQPGYVEAVLEYLKHSTVLCKITSHQLVDKFERYVVFEGNRLV